MQCFNEHNRKLPVAAFLCQADDHVRVRHFCRMDKRDALRGDILRNGRKSPCAKSAIR